MKKLNLIGVLAFLVILFSCNKADENRVEQTDNVEQKALSGQQINEIIRFHLEKDGDFEWSKVDAFVLWSALTQGNYVLTVGYSDNAFSTAGKSEKEKSIKQEIISTVQKIEGHKFEKIRQGQNILVAEGNELNFIDIHVADLETVKKLKENPNIRYMEPSGYQYFQQEPELRSSSGCSTAPETINAADYTTTTPNCQVSWTYAKHNIPNAWNYSTGSGITIGLIDTGISSSQSLLGSNFNQGASSGRSILKYGVYVNSIWPWATATDGPDDKCGHGTLMGATIASPRNNKNLPVGVAYNCNLIAYRATGDVVLDGYHEQRGVSRALTELANRPEVKVISMSIGHIFSVGSISDAVKYAYSKGKLIIAAGGTSTTFTNFVGVIFPANMSETVAATGITDGTGYTECAVCHKGSKIDFTVIMQRTGDRNRTSVCLGHFENTRNYVGGSSVATATTAGIAALIWSKNPTWSRAQVLAKMQQSASLYPNRNKNFGWGSINALAAVQ